MKMVLKLKPEDVEALQALSDATGETLEQVAYRMGIRVITESWLAVSDAAFAVEPRRLA